jgi:hypothetical protein
MDQKDTLVAALMIELAEVCIEIDGLDTLKSTWCLKEIKNDCCLYEYPFFQCTFPFATSHHPSCRCMTA